MTNDNTGFTLVEIMIAISIFSIGLLAVASLQISTSKSTKKSNIQTIAASFAENQIEYFHNQNMTNPASPDYYHVTSNGFGPSSTSGGSVLQKKIIEQLSVEGELIGTEDEIPPGGFLRTTSIQEVYLSSKQKSTFSLKITVGIAWKQGQHARKLSFDSITRGFGG